MTRFSAIRSSTLAKGDSPIFAETKIGTIPSTFPPHVAAIGAICLALAMTVGCQKPDASKANSEKNKPDATAKTTNDSPTGKPATAHEVLSRMVAAYGTATSYVDFGSARMSATADGQKLSDMTAKFSLAMVRPNKMRIRAYGAEMICDGKTLHAFVPDVPGQILARPAPKQLTMKDVQSDLVVSMNMKRGFAGGLPQVALSFGKDPLETLVRELGEPELSEPETVDGHKCYCVKLKSPDGTSTFWIDQASVASMRKARQPVRLVYAVTQ